MQFTDVGTGFDDFFVAHIDGHKGDGLARITQEAAYGHGQHAGARLEHATTAAAAAFHEIFDGKAARCNGVQIFAEHGGIQRVVTEAATHEEGAPASQNGTDNGQVQIDAGGNVRRHQAIAKHHEGQQQVIDVAAVAGHVNNFVIAGHLGQVVHVVQTNPAV